MLSVSVRIHRIISPYQYTIFKGAFVALVAYVWGLYIIPWGNKHHLLAILAMDDLAL